MSGVFVLGAMAVLALPVIVVVVIVVAVRRPGQGLTGTSLRRFFQYLLAFGLVMTVAVAATVAATVAADGVVDRYERTDLVGAVTAAVVGGLLLGGVGWWIARDLRRPEERRAAGWRWYLTLTCLVALAVAAVATGLVLDAAQTGELDAVALAVALVWAVVWGAHRWLEHVTVPPADRAAHLFLGSLAGLVTLTCGVVLTLGALGRLALSPGALFVSGGSRLTGALAVLVVGAAVWAGHWLLGYRHAERRPAWLVLVLPVGVGGGTVLAVVGASRALYQALVWFAGTPVEPTALGHFASAPTALAAAATGVGLVAYHRAVLGGGPVTAEVARVHHYLVSGLALGAAAVGVGMLAAAGVGALGPAPLIGSGGNGLIAAATMLVVAGPLWWLYWGRIARATAADPGVELASPTRRVYLVILFGVLAVVAAGAILVAAVGLVLALVEGSPPLVAVATVRGAVGVLLAAGTVAWYHGTVFRADRAYLRAVEPAPAPPADDAPPPGAFAPPPEAVPPAAAAVLARVVLLGPADPAVAAAVADRTGARVETWVSDVVGPWGAAEVLAALADVPGEVAVVVSEEAGPRARAVIPPG